jgi:UDP-N-acetyl-D-mannosaminuronic acid transferase (WecB/TagA/CpsF family)
LYRRFKILTTKPQNQEGQIKQTIKLLNVDISNISKAELLSQLEQGIVFTPNVDHLIKLQRDQEFLQAYEIATYKICDSKVLLL